MISIVVISLVSFIDNDREKTSLRELYAKPVAQWPKPEVDSGVHWTELGVLPPGPVENRKEELKHKIELGKILFFDPRLSSSNKISCATCHQPELHWTDGKEKSEGHEGAKTARNAPTILNSWVYKKLFWDGRAHDLADQAFGPIESESEMNSEMPELMMELRRIKGYKELFKNAYGDERIDVDRMTNAIAEFEKTIISEKSRFDKFLEGDKNALTNAELRGLHLFRTKARCMNCHNGPLFTDNLFHNIGFSGNDVGLYKVTHLDADSGKFKTPSLRDVIYTGPWMHDGMYSLEKIVNTLNNPPRNAQISPLIKPLGLTKRERKDLLAFLKAISAGAPKFDKPILPE